MIGMRVGADWNEIDGRIKTTFRAAFSVAR